MGSAAIAAAAQAAQLFGCISECLSAVTPALIYTSSAPARSGDAAARLASDLHSDSLHQPHYNVVLEHMWVAHCTVMKQQNFKSTSNGSAATIICRY